jgi:hypothetical protein
MPTINLAVRRNTMTLTETMTMVKHRETRQNTLKDWGLSPGGSPALATAERWMSLKLWLF